LLLVDDDTDSRQVLSGVSHFAGYHLLQVPDAQAAFDLLAAQEVGVIVCDQTLAGMSGVEFFSRVRRMYPRTVRVMLNGHGDVALIADAINRGNVYKFLCKPWNERELVSVLDAAFVQYENESRLASCV
jgi:DNA-binding NtrC family response regulator